MYDEVMPNDQFITVVKMTKFVEGIYSTLRICSMQVLTAGLFLLNSNSVRKHLQDCKRLLCNDFPASWSLCACLPCKHLLNVCCALIILIYKYLNFRWQVDSDWIAIPNCELIFITILFGNRRQYSAQDHTKYTLP